MKHILALAVSLAIIFCQVVGEAEEDTSYNAAEVIAARTAHYKKVCAKYRDPRRVEYPALFEQPIHLTTGHNRNIIQNLFLCVPPKVGSMAWTKVFRRLYGQVISTVGPSHFEADLKGIVIFTNRTFVTLAWKSWRKNLATGRKKRGEKFSKKPPGNI